MDFLKVRAPPTAKGPYVLLYWYTARGDESQKNCGFLNQAAGRKPKVHTTLHKFRFKLREGTTE